MSISEIKEEVVLMGSSLEVDETARDVCPFCGGVNTFTVTRVPAGYVYNCYKASCGFYGFVPAKGYTPEKSEKPRKPSNVFRERLEHLPQHAVEFFLHKFGVDLSLIMKAGITWCPSLERVVIPLRDFRGTPQAIMTRRYDELQQNKDSLPKGMLFDTEGWCGLNFYIKDPDVASVLMVEDYMSALKASLFINSVSLQGTHLPENALEYLLDNGVEHVILALDEDATKKALEMKLKYQIYFQQFDVILLKKDIKDMKLSEIRGILL